MAESLRGLVNAVAASSGFDATTISTTDRDRIFDPFVRLDESRSRQEGGAGLGLTIAHDIITAHQGSLSVDDRTTAP